MDSSDGVELLLDAGLDRRVRSSDEVDIATDSGRWSRRQVLLLRHSPSPREIDRALASLRPHVDGLLFVVARAGRALDQAADQDVRLAYAAVDDAVVCFERQVHPVDRNRQMPPKPAGRTSWTRLAMLRLFTLGPADPLSQSEIARRLGVSHVAVGKQLPPPEGLVRRTPAGWQVSDRQACWDRFMADYPGPRGLTTYWAAIDDLGAQLDRIESLARQHGDAAPAVSGDFAADFYAPWRRPNRIVAYVAAQLPLEKHRFATVRSADATVELHTPTDSTVLAMSREWPLAGGGATRRYVDPLITAWDLRRSPGGDVDSAVNELRARTLREPEWK